MSSWISRTTASHNAQLITTAVVSGVVVGGAILGFQQARRLYRVADLKASIPEEGDPTRVRNFKTTNLADWPELNVMPISCVPISDVDSLTVD
jgi:hypothetical protein